MKKHLQKPPDTDSIKSQFDSDELPRLTRVPSPITDSSYSKKRGLEHTLSELPSFDNTSFRSEDNDAEMTLPTFSHAGSTAGEGSDEAQEYHQENEGVEEEAEEAGAEGVEGEGEGEGGVETEIPGVETAEEESGQGEYI